MLEGGSPEPGEETPMAEAYTREELWERFCAQHLHVARLVHDQVKPDPLHSPPLPVQLYLLADGQLSVTVDTDALQEYTSQRIVAALPSIVEAFLDAAFTDEEPQQHAA